MVALAAIIVRPQVSVAAILSLSSRLMP